jgi:hypothetical protein
VPFLSKNSRKGPFPADVLLVNGPGTCFVLCAAVYLNKVRMPIVLLAYSDGPITVSGTWIAQTDIRGIIRSGGLTVSVGQVSATPC